MLEGLAYLSERLPPATGRPPSQGRRNTGTVTDPRACHGPDLEGPGLVPRCRRHRLRVRDIAVFFGNEHFLEILVAVTVMGWATGTFYHVLSLEPRE
jgi:hypothetical protein